MMGKTKLLKIWRALSGIAAEVIMTVVIMAVAYGLSWVISHNK